MTKSVLAGRALGSLDGSGRQRTGQLLRHHHTPESVVEITARQDACGDSRWAGGSLARTG